MVLWISGEWKRLQNGEQKKYANTGFGFHQHIYKVELVNIIWNIYYETFSSEQTISWYSDVQCLDTFRLFQKANIIIIEAGF